MELKIKFSVEDESSVTTNEGEESYDSEQVGLTEFTGIVMRMY